MRVVVDGDGMAEVAEECGQRVDRLENKAGQNKAPGQGPVRTGRITEWQHILKTHSFWMRGVTGGW